MPLSNISAHNMISKWFLTAAFLIKVLPYSTHLDLCATSLLSERPVDTLMSKRWCITDHRLSSRLTGQD